MANRGIAGAPPQFGVPALAQSLPQGVTQINVGLDGRFLLAVPQDDADGQDVLHVLLNWGRRGGVSRILRLLIRNLEGERL